MSFLLPDDDDDQNPFANAVSPFASFTPAAAPPPPPPPADYGSPLPTPGEDAVGHTTGPYVQALTTDDDGAGGSLSGSVEGEERSSSSNAFVNPADGGKEDANERPASPVPPPSSLGAPAPASPDAFAGGFQSSPTVQAAFDIYRPASPPPLGPAVNGGAFGTSSPPSSSTTTAFGGAPTPTPSSSAGKRPPTEITASLADLLGESESARLKGAFRKAPAGGGGGSAGVRKPLSTTTATTKTSTSTSKGEGAEALDDDDPFGALVRRRHNKGKTPAAAAATTGAAAAASPASRSSAGAAATRPQTMAAAPLATAVDKGGPLPTPATTAASAAGQTSADAGSAPAPTDAAAPVAPLGADDTAQATAVGAAEEVPLPPSRPGTTDGTPRSATPAADASNTVDNTSTDRTSTPPPTTTTASSSIPSAATSSAASTSSRPSSPRGGGGGGGDDTADDDADRYPQPGRVERSFSELTLDPARAQQLGLGVSSVSSAGGHGGWTTEAPLSGGGGWGGEEERLDFGGQPGESNGPGEDDDESEAALTAPPVSAAATEPAAPPAPVDKDFQRAAKRADRLFVVHISDPTKVGLGATAHIVYTVTTTLRVPTEYGTQSKEVAVLRRFSDFLWLFGALSEGNRGVVVPPVPDKQSFGRFGDEFIAHRRAQLQTFLSKTAEHAVLQLDPVLTAFLTADNWSGEMKHWTRSRALDGASAAASGGSGGGEKGYLASLTSGLTGPKFVERDDWFDDRRAALDTLEGQLKALVKSVDLVSKQRLDLGGAIHDFSLSIATLAQCDLSRPMALALERFSDVLRRAKEKEEGNGRGDVGGFMATSDEYIRLIGSVRNAFATRIKSYLAWQNLELDARRQRTQLDKARRQGKLAAERVGQEIALVGDAERRAKEAGSEFESVTRLIKNEYGRFEDERIDDFKAMLESYVEGMIHRQKTLISAYEEYHTSLVRLVQQSQPQPPSPVQPKLNSPPRPTTSSANGGDSPERSRAGPGGAMAGGPNPFAEEEGERPGGDALASLPVENAWA